MAVVTETRSRATTEKTTKKHFVKHVLLSAGLGLVGVQVADAGKSNLPGIERQIAHDGAILDHLEVAGKAASGESTRTIGGRTFPTGFREPNMGLVARNAKVATLLIDMKGGSEGIKKDLEGIIAQAPNLGRVSGDTDGIQNTVARSAEQFDDELGALHTRQKINLLAIFGGGLTAVAYPALLLGRKMLEKRKKKEDSTSAQTEMGNPPTDISEEPVDVDMPGWMAKDLARRGVLLSKISSETGK